MILDFKNKLIEEINPEKYDEFLTTFITHLKEKAKKLKDKSPYVDFVVLQNYLIFFMTITINLKDESNYVYCIFDKKKNFFKQILDIMLGLPSIHKNLFLGIFGYLFQQEYTGLYYGLRNECYIRSRYLDNGNKYNDKLLKSFYLI